MNTYHARARLSTAAIALSRIVKGTTTDRTVTQSSAAADKHVGVSLQACTAAGDELDIAHDGMVRVQCGGTVAFGDFLTSDANGKAVVATAGERFCLVAQENGTDTEIIDALIQHGMVDTPDT